MVETSIAAEVTKGIDLGILSMGSNLSGTYVFISFDLVNSTAFKTKCASWPQIFQKFYDLSIETMKEKLPSAAIWKTIGDEVLFFLPLSNISQILEIPKNAFSVLEACVKRIQSEPKVGNELSLKGTIWIAYVKDGEFNEAPENFLVKQPDLNSVRLDFLGPDIDVGFRISKFAFHKKLVIDAKLAYLFYDCLPDVDKGALSQLFRIVSYEPLKGVWDGRRYPIVWFYKTWEKVETLEFLYDDRFNSEIVNRIFDKGVEKLNHLKDVTKIIEDTGRKKEIEKLKTGILEFVANNPEGFIPCIVQSNKYCEIHIVAVVVNEKKAILIGKRPQGKVFPDLWEFGCSQLTMHQDIKTSLIDGYQKDFGITIDFPCGEPIPIGIYSFENKEKRVVPGVVFLAVGKSTELVAEKVVGEKHSLVKWASLTEIEGLPAEACVPGFHDRVKKAIAVLESLPNKKSSKTKKIIGKQGRRRFS